MKRLRTTHVCTAMAAAMLLFEAAAAAGEPNAEAFLGGPGDPAPLPGQVAQAILAPTAATHSQAVVEPLQEAPVRPSPSAPAAPEAPDWGFGDKDSVWGKVTLSYRLRPEFRENADLDASATDTSLIAYQRARVGAMLNYSDWLHSFIQFQDSRTMGTGNATNAYVSNADLHLAWVRLDAARGRVQLTLGRQQLVYGDHRLIGHLEWANRPRTYDGAKLRLKTSRVGWLDLFGAVFTPDTSGNLMISTTLSGAYHQLSLASGSLILEQYLIGLTDTEYALAPKQTYATVEFPSTGFQRKLITVGTRAKADRGPFFGTLEAAYQGGKSSVEEGIAQKAWFAHLDLGLRLPGSVKPAIKLEGNVGSGDKADTTDASERFNNLFPTNHMHYGSMDLQNLSNGTNFSVTASLKPGKRVSTKLAYWVLARTSLDDGWFDAGGKELAAVDTESSTASEKLIGHEIDLTVKVVLNKFVSVTNGVSYFTPSGFGLTRGSDPQVWAFTMLLTRF